MTTENSNNILRHAKGTHFQGTTDYLAIVPCTPSSAQLAQQEVDSKHTSYKTTSPLKTGKAPWNLYFHKASYSIHETF